MFLLAWQAAAKKRAKVSEAFEGVKRDEKKRKYRAQGKEEERIKRARSGAGGRRKGAGAGEDD